VTTRHSVRRARSRERPSRYSVASSKPIVVDASIAFLWFVNEPDRWGAARLLESESTLLSPEFMVVEATSALWKKLRRREIDLADVEQAVTNLLALEIEWTPSVQLIKPAARLAAELGHPVYDCLYLTLAASHSASLASADERLRHAAERLGIRIWRSP
jgi:predicted nucleic acid-binding protein